MLLVGQGWVPARPEQSSRGRRWQARCVLNMAVSVGMVRRSNAITARVLRVAPSAEAKAERALRVCRTDGTAPLRRQRLGRGRMAATRRGPRDATWARMAKTQNIAGKVVVITGRSGGLGAATSRHLAAQGAKLVVADRSTDKLERLAQEIRSSGAQA